jgi:hypothetical protein
VTAQPQPFDPLWLSPIASPVALIEVPDTQVFQVVLESLTNQGGSIHLLPLCSDVSGLQEFHFQNDLYGFHCGLCSTI